MVQGTLDMLILQTLVLGPAHGQTIAHAIERGSEDVVQVEHGSLYPALHRLQNRGWIASFLGTTVKRGTTASRLQARSSWRINRPAGTNWCGPSAAS
jgi:hypothetical protein